MSSHMCTPCAPGSWRFECARGREKPAFLFKVSRRPQQLSIKVVAWKSLQLLYPNQISSWKLWHLQKEIALPTLSWLNENDCFQLAYLDFGCHEMLFEIHIHTDVLPFKREWLLLRPTARWDQRQHRGPDLSMQDGHNDNTSSNNVNVSRLSVFVEG